MPSMCLKIRNESRFCCVRCSAARQHSNFDFFFHLKPSGRKLQNKCHSLLALCTLMRPLHTTCQFRNKPPVFRVFNMVWPLVRHKMSSSYFIMFLKNVLKTSADISACCLIEYERHTFRFFFTCGKISVEKCQSQLSQAADGLITAGLSRFYHLFFLLEWTTVALISLVTLLHPVVTAGFLWQSDRGQTGIII